MAVAVAPTALGLADEYRTECRPWELWRLAHSESEGRQDRQVRYRHALIHAGHLRTAKGKLFKRCPMCHRRLHFSTAERR